MSGWEICLIQKEIVQNRTVSVPFGKYKYVAILFALDGLHTIVETPVIEDHQANEKEQLHMFIGRLAREGWEPMPVTTVTDGGYTTDIKWYFKRPILAG